MKKMKILVTGGTGYIGSHTVVELINSGFDVLIADNLSNSNIDVLSSIKKITGVEPAFTNIDLSDQEKTANYFSQLKNIDAIIHFAAFKAVGESVEKPLKYYKNNIQSLINVVEGMQNNNFNNLVFSSSCTVYGQAEKLPVTEETPILKADSPYGNTKQICEEIISDYSKMNINKKFVLLRYFNPIGAHESGLIGELPIGVPGNLVPFITQTTAGLREVLSVYGNDYNTFDGTPIRDYIHVTDLAKAHVLSVKRMFDTNNSNLEIFNLGTGRGNSVLEVIKTFEEVTNQKINYKIEQRRPGDIEQVWADTKLANTILGWKAELSLAQALLSSWNWEKKYREKQK